MVLTEPIKVTIEAKKILKELKTHPRETYGDVINRLLRKQGFDNNELNNYQTPSTGSDIKPNRK